MHSVIKLELLLLHHLVVSTFSLLILARSTMKPFSSIAVPLLTVLTNLPSTSTAQSEARLENCQGRYSEFDHSKFDIASNKINLQLKLNDKLPLQEFKRQLKERQLPNGNAHGYWESDDGSALSFSKLNWEENSLVPSPQTDP
jgi:hypothetical protein